MQSLIREEAALRPVKRELHNSNGVGSRRTTPDAWKARVAPETAASVPRYAEDDGRKFRSASAAQMATLTRRQTEVLDLVLAGCATKMIAFKLHLSERTVDNHRARIAHRLKAHSLPELAHIAFCARCHLGETASEVPPSQAISSLSVTRPIAPGQCLAENQLPSPAHKGRTPADEVDAMRVVMREAQHRMQNMAAIILSLTRQTKHESINKDDFDRRFGDRISAFCRSMNAMVECNWDDIDLRDLLSLQLDPFGGLDGQQISAEGPKLEVAPHAAQALGLALHELATNAAKYGALSRPSGRVALSWTIVGDAFDRSVIIRWTEAGGPVVAPVEHSGFGTTLITRLTAQSLNAETTYCLRPEGAAWVLTMPLAGNVSPA